MTDVVPNGTVEVRTDEKGDHEHFTCDCYHSIISVVPLDSTITDAIYGLNASNPPNGCGSACRYFSGVGSISGCHTITGSCVVSYPVPPIGNYDFNCLLNTGSPLGSGITFNVGAFSIPVDPECVITMDEAPDIAITYQICCSKIDYTGCNNISCSAATTIITTMSTNDDHIWRVNETECGCTPTKL